MIEGTFNSQSQHLGDERDSQRLRSRKLRSLGYARSEAAFLATTNIDIGLVERLIVLGCPRDLAVRIAS